MHKVQTNRKGSHLCVVLKRKKKMRYEIQISFSIRNDAEEWKCLSYQSIGFEFQSIVE